ncbi:MAG: citryl-CoA lyase, partial [Thermoplasmata archaeon]
LLKGRLPNENEGRMMDAILTSSVDHGITPPSCVAARTVASAGVPLPTAVAAGVLAIGEAHGGAIEGCAKMLQECVIRAKEEKKSYEEIAAEVIKESKSKKTRILGFGHRFHTKDPRTAKLFLLAEELGIANEHEKMARAFEGEFAKSGKPLPINVDGAIGAIISDMGFDYRLGKGFFLMGRVTGLVAEVYEEMTREKPMRRISPSKHEYDGPWERDLPERYTKKEKVMH